MRTRDLNGFVELFPDIAQPNSLQTATLQLIREQGVYVIEGPMGYGKTEAALAASYRSSQPGRPVGCTSPCHPGNEQSH